MFQLEPVNEVTTTIEIQVPITDSRSRRQDFQVTFKKLSVDDAKKMGIDLSKGVIDEDDMLLNNILDVQGVKDAQGVDIPFTEDLVKQLLNIEYVRNPMSEMFQRITLGQKAYANLQRKNS